MYKLYKEDIHETPIQITWYTMLIMFFVSCHAMPGILLKEKKYLFEIGYKNYKDLELVTKTIQDDAKRITVIRSSTHVANPTDLLRQYKFNFLSEPMPCNAQSFTDIIHNVHTIIQQLFNLGYNPGSGIHFIIDDQYNATAYYFEHANADLTIIAQKKYK